MLWGRYGITTICMYANKRLMVVKWPDLAIEDWWRSGRDGYTTLQTFQDNDLPHNTLTLESISNILHVYEHHDSICLDMR